ncbi:SAM-dependent methyltransferase [Actinophytocola xinjiangensis]|uniref:S-adenosyl-L-methionine-dependent methyltransferase n=1 Tax=Actinophytocola xinjiangensis TaxID=485602 RepID=A0A7Z0WHJ9_9PSEU|nr:SAM-dependent methyltransferase [Actinophytocola xinjiangensis]
MTDTPHGVGLTALLVAAARAIETHRTDSLAQDHHAEHFVRAAHPCRTWPLHPHDIPGGDTNPLWGRLARYFGLRTRVLDDHLLHTTHHGARQIVLLGAGLDTRAYRLPWPPDCHVYEIDRPEVLTFKHHVLDRLHLTPHTTRTPISADLRTDWAPALTAAGFDPTTPCAWLAEGLLLYLPSAPERHLIDTVDRLSAPGSTLAYEIKTGWERPEVRASPVYSATLRQTGVDLLALFDREPRPDSAADLTTRGWTTTTHTPYDFTRHHGRGPLPEPHDALAANRWIFATKPAPTSG